MLLIKKVVKSRLLGLGNEPLVLLNKECDSNYAETENFNQSYTSSPSRFGVNLLSMYSYHPSSEYDSESYDSECSESEYSKEEGYRQKP